MLADADRLANGRMTTVALTLIGVVTAAFLVGPRSSPALLLTLAAVPFAWAPLADLRREAERSAWPFILALAFGTYLLVSVAWSADRVEAIGKVALYFAFTGAVWVACSSAAAINDRLLERVLGTLLIAFAGGLIYLCLEELGGHALKRLVFNLVPGIRLPERHMIITDGTIDAVRAYTTNRNMAAVSLALWPVLLAAQSLLAEAKGRIAALSMLAIAALTISLSQHDTSVVALIVSVAVFGLARRWPRFALGLIAAGWITATLLVVPITNAAYRDVSLHFAAWLPYTARQRVILWGYTAEQVSKSPWTGVGIASTKTIDARRTDVEPTPPGFVYPLRTGPHAHNIYLQTWYELGAIGAVLLMVLGLGVLRSIARVPKTLMPYALASFAAASIVGAFSWGMWQAWFMAGFGIAAVLTVTSLELAARQSAMRPGVG
jgi:hypothetical protein